MTVLGFRTVRDWLLALPPRAVTEARRSRSSGSRSSWGDLRARRVLQHLVAAGAVGVVTTHDLSLANAEVFVGHVRHVHFPEQLDRGQMTYDYRARPGKATSTNALALLALVGLGGAT